MILVESKKPGQFIGLLFRNTNAVTAVIRYTDDGKSIFSYITTGGQIEIYILMHGSPK